MDKKYEIRKKIRLAFVFSIGMQLILLLGCIMLIEISTNSMNSWTKDSGPAIAMFVVSLIFYGRNISLSHDINDLTNHRSKRLVHFSYYGIFILYSIELLRTFYKVNSNKLPIDLENTNTKNCINCKKTKKSNNKKNKS